MRSFKGGRVSSEKDLAWMASWKRLIAAWCDKLQQGASISRDPVNYDRLGKLTVEDLS